MPRKRLPRSLPPSETDALAGVAKTPRDRLIVLAGSVCALRVSEITGLEVPDLDLDAGTLLVRRGKGDRDRSVPVPGWLCGEFRDYLGGRATGPVFPSRSGGGRLSSRAVQRLLVRLGVAAGLPDAGKPRRCNPHRLRHAAATTLLRSGMDIVELRDYLGHSSISTTQVYLSADATRMRAASEKAFRPPERKAG